MESKRKIGSTSVIFLTLIISACASAPKEISKPKKLPITSVTLGITQVGYEKNTRYVFCETSACPSPTLKTPVDRNVSELPITTKPNVVTALDKQNKVIASLDIPFPFNSSRMKKADVEKLKKLVAEHTGATVEIIARSDFVGPPKGQLKVASARALAMRKIVAKQTQGSQITERQEIAAPTRVPTDTQSKQRQGSVRFTSPSPTSSQGENK